MDVRDSCLMRTKSLRMPSFVSSSTKSVPVRPPARPVQTTGAPSCFSARATLIPFPPALGKPTLARWRWPGWKFGTTSVRSIAALSVTVTIIRLDTEKAPETILAEDPRPAAARARSEARDDRGDHVAHLVHRTVGVPACALAEGRCRHVPGGHEIDPGHLAVVEGDHDLAELLALPDR